MTSLIASSYLYSDPFNVGERGLKARYSICRTVAWLDECLTPMPHPLLHDMAVIRHDVEQYDLDLAIECILMHGLLSPVTFIGLRKNKMSLLLSADFRNNCGRVEERHYAEQIAAACHAVAEGKLEILTGTYDRSKERPTYPSDLAGIIPAVSSDTVSTYLRYIHLQWQLGLKPYQPEPPPDFCSTL